MPSKPLLIDLTIGFLNNFDTQPGEQAIYLNNLVNHEDFLTTWWAGYIFERPGEQGTFAEHRVSPSPPRTPGCSCYLLERWFSLVSLLVVEETHKCDLPIGWWHMYIVRKGKAHELPGVLSATFCSGTPVLGNWWNQLLPKVSAWRTKEKQNRELPIENDTSEKNNNLNSTLLF